MPPRGELLEATLRDEQRVEAPGWPEDAATHWARRLNCCGQRDAARSSIWYDASRRRLLRSQDRSLLAKVPAHLGGVPGSHTLSILTEPITQQRLPRWRALGKEEVRHQPVDLLAGQHHIADHVPVRLGKEKRQSWPQVDDSGPAVNPIGDEPNQFIKRVGSQGLRRRRQGLLFDERPGSAISATSSTETG